MDRWPGRRKLSNDIQICILIVLCRGGIAHGVAIANEVGNMIEGFPYAISSIYRYLEFFLRHKWIEDVTYQYPDVDRRRRYYRITPDGSDVLHDHMDWVRELVRYYDSRMEDRDGS